MVRTSERSPETIQEIPLPEAMQPRRRVRTYKKEITVIRLDRGDKRGGKKKEKEGHKKKEEDSGERRAKARGCVKQIKGQ